MSDNETGLGISKIAIRRHVGTLMLTIAVIVIGVFYVSQIPVDLLPSITYPRIGVRIDAEGISPQVAVDEITRPLEQGLAATEGVTQIFSRTREGQVSIDLFFEPGGDLDRALNDATASVNRVRNRLPDNIESPRLFKFDPSQQPIYEFAITSSELQPVELRVFGDEELARELTVIPGVAGVDVSGGVEEEIQLNLNLNSLQNFGVPINRILGELSDRNQDISGGRLKEDKNEPLTRTVGRFTNAKDLETVSFQTNSNPPQRVYLKDIATIVDGTEDQRVKVSLNGQPAVKISILKQPDANTITVVDGIKKKIEQLRASGQISDKMKFVTTYDESIFIQNSLNNVIDAGVSGGILAGITVLLFLGSIRQTLVVVLSIPLCLLMGVILMKWFGFSLNMFSLGGLAIGIGQVVDASSVILENIVEGVSRYPRWNKRIIIEETINRSSEVESALIASVATNLVSVAPFLLIGGFFSLLFNELILTSCFAVGVSLIVAITVTPMLMSRLLAIPYTSGINKNFIIRGFNNWFEGFTQLYKTSLTQVLKWRLSVILVTFAILGYITISLGSQLTQEILPEVNTSQARLIAIFPSGINLETNIKVMEEADRILLQQPETRYTLSTSGGLLFGNNTIENLLRGSSVITLAPGTNVTNFVDRVSEELKQKLKLPPKTRLRLFPESIRGLILTNSPVRGGQLDVILQSNNTRSLQTTAREVLDLLDKKAKLATFRPDGDAPQPEIQIKPDWEQVSLYGLNSQEIGQTVETAINGSIPTQLQRENRLVDIRVQFDRMSVKSIGQLQQIPILARDGSLLKLGDIASISPGRAPGEIQRLNQKQVFAIVGNLKKGASLGQSLQEINDILSTYKFPPDVFVVPSSAKETNQQLQNALVILSILSIFLVFVVMAVQYNSLIDPLVIMFTVPLALAGVTVGLWISKTAMGATVLLGIVMLVGIVVNNAIIMIEFANQIRDNEKCDRYQAIIKAAPQRLRPIAITTITTVLGLFPLALGWGDGSEFLKPLGVVIFYGLGSATLLTLFIIPCFYLLLNEPFKSVKKSVELEQIPTKTNF